MLTMFRLTAREREAVLIALSWVLRADGDGLAGLHNGLGADGCEFCGAWMKVTDSRVLVGEP